jgi:DNA-binding response OmpR family regulator
MLPSSNPVVLVADDEPSMLELVAQHLKTLDDPRLEVIEASDGEQAWKLAREHLPDLVVLDVMMPGMSGWEVCRKIREDVALAHTGVVMLTGIGENLNQMTSPLYGADAYIDKPFDFEELDEKVKAALSARASQRDAVQRPAKNVNGVAGPAKAAKEARVSSASKKKKTKKGKAAKKSAPSKMKVAAKAKTRLSSKSVRKQKLTRKGETTMAAKKKSAKKGAKKAAKKTAKKKAK